MSRSRVTADPDRFWAKVDKSGSCWIWQGTRNGKSGYGQVYGFSETQAHRVAYILTYGAIPEGLFILHHCNNKGCVRPDHLFAGTAKQNRADRTTLEHHTYKTQPYDRSMSVIEAFADRLIRLIRKSHTIAADYKINRKESE